MESIAEAHVRLIRIVVVIRSQRKRCLNALAHAGSTWLSTTIGSAAWSDRELERAIRSGVSRDGRQLHWQGMTWDQLSNLEEEDLRAIVSYLRLLPPVNRIVPVPRPPAADDCEAYTFYLDKSDQPGCR